MDYTSNSIGNIVKLNKIFQNSEYFRVATSTDGGCINIYNINECGKTIELYAYLYKHPELIDKLFDDNVYKVYKTISNLMNYMIVNKLTAAQACKKLLEN